MSSVTSFSIRKFSKLVIKGDDPIMTKNLSTEKPPTTYWHRYPQRSQLMMTFIKFPEKAHLYVYHRGVRLEKVDLGLGEDAGAIGEHVFVELYPSIALKQTRNGVTRRYQVGFDNENEFKRCCDFLEESGLGVRPFKKKFTSKSDYVQERVYDDESQMLCSQIPQVSGSQKEKKPEKEASQMAYYSSQDFQLTQDECGQVCGYHDLYTQTEEIEPVAEKDVFQTGVGEAPNWDSLETLMKYPEMGHCYTQNSYQSTETKYLDDCKIDESDITLNSSIENTDSVTWERLDMKELETLSNRQLCKKLYLFFHDQRFTTLLKKMENFLSEDYTEKKGVSNS